MNGARLTPRDVTIWIAPRVLFAGSAVLLAFASARGWSATGLTVAVALFVLSSLAFVGRQIICGHGTSRGLLVTGVVLCALGAVALATYAFTGADVLPLVGSVLVLLGVGWLVEVWRRAAGAALRWWGAGLLGLAVVATGLAAGLLFAGVVGPGPALAVIGVALLLVLPVSLNLLAEFGVGRVRDVPLPGRFRMQRRPWVIYLAGAVLVAAAGFCLALALGDWLVSAAIVAIVMVLILATVSNTHADIAVLLAVVALLAAAPLESPTPDAATNQGGPGTLVALGDSYMSGEGARTYYAGTDDAGGNECRRSPSAYAARLVFEERRFERLAFLACSAARTHHVVASADADGQSRVQPGEAGTQVDQLTELTGRSGNPSLVVVGIGGNDAGFATIGEICLAPGDCSSQRALFEHNLPSVRRALVATYTSIRKAVSNVPVLAIPYPQPFADRSGCDGIALTKRERDFIRAFVDRLNETVRVAAVQAGLRYVPDMKDSLAAHRLQLCDADKDSAGLNFLDVRSVNGLATQRFNPTRWLHNSLHPNERGHAAMAETLADWLRRNGDGLATPGQPPAGPTGSAVDPDAVAEPEPPCSMTVTEAPSCQALAREWEINQVLSVARWGAAAVLAALVLLWTAGVVLIGRLDAVRRGRRRRLT